MKTAVLPEEIKDIRSSLLSLLQYYSQIAKSSNQIEPFKGWLVRSWMLLMESLPYMYKAWSLDLRTVI